MADDVERDDKPLSVVVIDDSEDFRLIFRALCRTDDRFALAGEAAGGHAGIAICQEVRPEVVVLDLAMPSMDGQTALPIIKAVCPDARVVIYSAHLNPAVGARLLEAGANAVLVKGEPLPHVFDVLAGGPA